MKPFDLFAIDDEAYHHTQLDLDFQIISLSLHTFITATSITLKNLSIDQKIQNYHYLISFKS